MTRASDLFEDLAGGFCPDERLGLGVVLIEIVHDGSLQFTDAREYAAPDALARDQAEEAFDLIEPGRRSHVVSQPSETEHLGVDAPDGHFSPHAVILGEGDAIKNLDLDLPPSSRPYPLVCASGAPHCLRHAHNAGRTTRPHSLPSLLAKGAQDERKTEFPV